MISSGALPDGLTLNCTTGGITGTPTTPGNFDVSASNGIAPDTTVPYTLTTTTPTAAPPRPMGSGPSSPTAGPAGANDTASTLQSSTPELAFTGSGTPAAFYVAGLLLFIGSTLVIMTTIRRKRATR
jgi:type VI secretion system secreted protein VgrG